MTKENDRRVADHSEWAGLRPIFLHSPISITRSIARGHGDFFALTEPRSHRVNDESSPGSEGARLGSLDCQRSSTQAQLGRAAKKRNPPPFDWIESGGEFVFGR